MDKLINSESYWDERFRENWEEYSGSEQTKFFAKLMCNLLPSWFIRKVRENNYTACDMGCALGDAVPVLSQFLNIEVDGCDFSETAIQAACKKYPEYNFKKIDLTCVPEDFHYDVLIVSNVLEHFAKPWGIMKNLTNTSCHYIVLMVPYQETLTIKEHIYKFDNNVIPLHVNQFGLVYCNAIDGATLKPTYYPDQQVLLVYSSDIQDQKTTHLSDISNLDIKLKNQLNETKTINNNVMTENNKLQQQVEKLIEEKSHVEVKLKEVEDIIALQKKELAALTSQVDVYKAKNEKLVDLNEKLEESKATLDEKTDALNEELDQAYNQVKAKEQIILRTVSQCVAMADSNLFKMTHFLNRLKYQGIKGNKEERKKFRKWLFNKLRGKGGDFDRRYNPLYGVINILKDAITINALNTTVTGSVEDMLTSPINLSPMVKQSLLQEYNKFDVIIFSVIDYDFRHQRPQHFAVRFAENGHRVFYVNANYHNPAAITELQKNLYVVNIHSDAVNAIYETDWTSQSMIVLDQLNTMINNYGIRDAVTIVDYPNWVYVAEQLRKIYGFKIVTDYMDDYTGFLNPAEDLVRKSCERLLKSSDKVVASSQFLYDIARKYQENAAIIRNGTEYDHFHTAIGENIHERKIIGYYGAIAEWFDFEKVIYLAQHMPEYDIVLIGHVTAGKEKLSKYKNIKLLGEKPYSELPKYLKDFDVCLIPFDTSTDLIKATNPVKFYEYLSAGKKVVATEIPEIEPYKDKYVYLTNDNEKFLGYVKLCLNNEDTLAKAEECAIFAQENDWQHRYEYFLQICKEAAPKVSIIVLTYNNLEINKICINSILEKTAYPNYELIIVDNASIDGTKEYLQTLIDSNEKLHIVFNEENRGFAGGNNDGIQVATGEYIVLLNNDTVITRGWLTAMSKHLENDDKLGMCGPVTNSIGNEAMIKAVYHTQEELQQFAYQYTMKHLNEEYADIDVLAFFCTMIKKAVIEQCGLLDETYGRGMFEDDDYAEAVKNKNYRLTVVEDAFIHHMAGASFKKLDDEEFRQLFENNKKQFEEKWNTRWSMHKYRDGVTWDANADVKI